ncbi:hypothetical protein [Sphingomonas sp.]
MTTAEMRAGLPVQEFADATAFDAWLAAQPAGCAQFVAMLARGETLH